MSKTKPHPTRVTLLQCDTSTELALPMEGASVRAGFPSPADNFLERKLDFNRDLVKHPESTIYGRVQGKSMINAGIDDGDILVVDRSLTARSGDIAVCNIDDEFTVKRIRLNKKEVWLIAENEDYKPIRLTEDNELTLVGIVTHTIKTFR